MKNTKNQNELILGLDLGTNSVGWALIRSERGASAGIVDAGVRIFSAGVNADPTSGKNESRAVDRRRMRMMRRQLARKKVRRKTVLRLLTKAGLLPIGIAPSRQPKKGEFSNWKKLLSVNVYELRTRALDEKLEPFELGRVLFHLAHRRGFKSNKKETTRSHTNAESKEELKGLKGEIKSLDEAIHTTGCRTLGEYFFKNLDLERRVRTRHTSRKMYREEFDLIWAKQAGYTPDLLDEKLRKALVRAIFYQRPIPSQKERVGKCELEPCKRRCAQALLHAQEARLLQDLNHLELVWPNGEQAPLTPDQRAKLLALLEITERLTFSRARKELGIKRSTGIEFNIEKGGREDIKGNVTAARIREVVGARWDEAGETFKTDMVDTLMGMENEDAIAGRARKVWGFDEEMADNFSQICLEDSYSGHSTKALNNLLPHLRNGLPYAQAREQAYPNKAWRTAEIHDELPPCENLRNPIVQRTLAEMRRVVNALITEYGKPGKIRIELARDLKQSAKNREADWKAMRSREKQRNAARKALIEQVGLKNPKPRDIEKWLLYEECGKVCPYTGKSIGASALFGDNPQFDIEHIIPFSRSLDNSFANKTLCEVAANRNEKKNLTPFEAYGQTDRWNDILLRVTKFTGEFTKEKLRRFMLEKVAGESEFMVDFASRNLNDTRYASVKAAESLAVLYPPDERVSRIQVSTGRTTSLFRAAWGLNRILGSGDAKSRDDHRHHAIDAVVIALTTPSMTHELSLAASRSWLTTRRAGTFTDMPDPWPDFEEVVRQAIGRIVVSHRVDRHLNGQLHQETYYGQIRIAGEERWVIRKSLARLTEAEIASGAIVDKAVRKAVEAKLAETGLKADKCFQNGQNTPYLVAKSGRRIPIHKVRVLQSVNPVTVAPGTEKARHVVSGNNYALEVFACKDKTDKAAWRTHVVSRREAMQRLRQIRNNRKGDIIRRQDEEGNPLQFSLVIGELIKAKWKGKEVICLVQGISQDFYSIRLNSDARPESAIRQQKDRMIIQSDATLYKLVSAKLAIDPIGRTHVSHN